MNKYNVGDIVSFKNNNSLIVGNIIEKRTFLYTDGEKSYYDISSLGRIYHWVQEEYIIKSESLKNKVYDFRNLHLDEFTIRGFRNCTILVRPEQITKTVEKEAVLRSVRLEVKNSIYKPYYEDFLRPSWFEPRHIVGCRSGKDISTLVEIEKMLEKKPTQFLSELLDTFEYFGLGERKEPMLPNKVIFNEEKKKVTLLFVDKKMKSKDGLRDVVTYKSYSSKATEKDHYHKEFGFYLSYYKYLNKDRDNKEFIDSIFNQKLIGAKLGYIKGAVHDIVKKRLTEISVFEDLVKEILKCEVEWDLHKHQEKLKLKKEREERIKARNEEINKREKEIERLRKQNDKETLEYLKANTPKDKLPFEV